MLESREDGDAAMRSLYAVVKMRRRRWPETCRAACGDVAAAAADASRVDQTRGEGGGWRVEGGGDGGGVVVGECQDARRERESSRFDVVEQAG